MRNDREVILQAMSMSSDSSFLDVPDVYKKDPELVTMALQKEGELVWIYKLIYIHNLYYICTNI